MKVIVFIYCASLIILAVISFVVVVVHRDKKRNAILAEQAERVIQALYGSRHGARGDWQDWRSHHQLAPRRVQDARRHRQARQQPVTHRPSAGLVRSELVEPSRSAPDDNVRESNGSDPQ